MQISFFDKDYLLKIRSSVLDNSAAVQGNVNRKVSFILQLQLDYVLANDCWSFGQRLPAFVIFEDNFYLNEFIRVDVSGLNKSRLNGENPKMSRCLQVIPVVVCILRKDRIQSAHQGGHLEFASPKSESSRSQEQEAKCHVDRHLVPEIILIRV